MIRTHQILVVGAVFLICWAVVTSGSTWMAAGVAVILLIFASAMAENEVTMVTRTPTKPPRTSNDSGQSATPPGAANFDRGDTQ
jgi:hypothetical protein